jgi:hypothetical protein
VDPTAGELLDINDALRFMVYADSLLFYDTNALL